MSASRTWSRRERRGAVSEREGRRRGCGRPTRVGASTPASGTVRRCWNRRRTSPNTEPDRVGGTALADKVLSLAAAGLLPLAARLSGSCARVHSSHAPDDVPPIERARKEASPPDRPTSERDRDRQRDGQEREASVGPANAPPASPESGSPASHAASRSRRAGRGGRAAGRRQNGGRERAGLERQRVLLALQVHVSECSPAEGLHGCHGAW